MGGKEKTLYISIQFQGLKDLVVVAVYTLGQLLWLNFVICEPSLRPHQLT